MTLVWIILAVVITYLVVKNSNKPQPVTSQHYEDEKKTEITEETVFKARLLLKKSWHKTICQFL